MRTNLPFSRLAFLGLLGGAILFLTEARATPETPGREGLADEEEAGESLPVWEAEDFREGFDVRLWPEQVVVWLEQENLRDLIADPETPESEKHALKRVLAMQQAWVPHP